MSAIVWPNGYYSSIPFGAYLSSPLGINNLCMAQTVHATRRARLEMLIKEHGDVLANLNEALGLERNSSILARVRNGNSRSGRPGKVYNMGDAQAREIEEKLGLPEGLMDTPPTYAELSADTRINHALKVMESMEDWQRDAAIKILAALAEQPKKNGTTDH